MNDRRIEIPDQVYAISRDGRTERRFFVDNTVIRDYGPIIGAYGIAVYCALCVHANLQTQDCWPGQTLIANLIKASERQVRRCLVQLRDLGLIHIEPHYREDGSQSSNTYVLLDPPPVASSPPPRTDSPPPHATQTTEGRTPSPPNNPHIEQSPWEQKDPGASAPVSEPDEFADLFDRPTPRAAPPGVGILESPAARDPLELAALCAQRQAAPDAFSTVPVLAGGTSTASEAMLDAWTSMRVLDPAAVPEETRRKWARTFDKLAAPHVAGGATADQCARAIRIVLDPHGSHGWYTYTDPAVEKFRRDWADVLMRLRSGDDVPGPGETGIAALDRLIERETAHGQ